MSKTARDIAIVGYACRLPKAADTDAFWSVLERGECVVGEIQPGRWARNRFGHPDKQIAGKSYTWRAGQLEDPWGFDPTFFGISPREALQIDPQQRILLQVAWEALEHAGIPAAKLAGTETGVFVGASSVDYSNKFVVDPSTMDIQLMTGNTLSIVSNRLSYIFDLKGPSFTVDTACSSSIVALNEAFEAMRSGRIDTAIVGGVNMLLSPFAFIGFSRASMLSPTGLCRAFDADGDGYVRSEGAVVFVLKTVEAARAAGDPIRGVIVGSGINSDGRTNGLSLPSMDQQAALLRRVYERFEIDPAALAYVEAHGTGTRVGDPAEATALGEVLGRRRTERLPIGSVKTNVGHLEAASGMVGLLKAQLVLERGVIPASLHFDTPNPDIPFDDLNIEVVKVSRPLAVTGTPLHAGVNSFGFGGANAHAILRQPAPHEARRLSEPSRLAPLVVSAQSPDALRSLAASYRDRFTRADRTEANRIANAAAYSRDRLDHRLVALGSTPADIAEALDAFLKGERSADHVVGRVAARAAPVAFCFSGNGSQWAGMGRAAYQSDAHFRSTFDVVTRLFIRVAGWSLLTELFSSDLEADIERTEIAQPLLFAVQVATVEALAARGIRPDMVTGHSVGEVAAAWASGALTLEAAVFLVHVRSTQQEVTRHLGGMAALLVSADEARKAVAEAGLRSVELAADNSPRSVTLSGTNEDITEFGRLAKKKRWALRKLKLDYPFHCALIEPIRKPLTDALATLNPHETSVAFYSSVTGGLVEGEALGAEYWWRNVRQPVLFRPAVEAMAEAGARVFVEIGPKPVLLTYLGDTLAGVHRSGAVIGSLDINDTVDIDIFGLLAAKALAHGAVIDDVRFFGPRAITHPDLPAYPWQNQSFKVEASAEAVDMFGSHDDHPLLGYQIRRGLGPWTGHVDTVLVPWLADHKVETSTVFPAAGFVEMALSAARAQLGEGPVELRDLDIFRPMVLEDGEPIETRTLVDNDDDVVEISSRRRLAGEDFALNARGRIGKPPTVETGRIELPEPTGPTLGAAALYEITRSFGLDYGPAFRRATAVTPAGPSALLVSLSADQAAEVGDAQHVLHPTILDASFHGLFWLIAHAVGAKPDQSFLPVRIGNLRVYAPGKTATGALITVTKASERSIEATFVLFDADQTVIARVTGVRFKAVLLNRAVDPDDFVFTTRAVRLPERDDDVVLPDAWSDPAARIRALRLTSEQGPEPDDASLLMDAGCRAIAYAAVAGLADETGAIDFDRLLADGRLHPSALPLLHRVTEALVEDDAVQDIDNALRIDEPSPYPTAETVIATLVAGHPRRIAEASVLVRLQATLAQRLSEGLVGDLDEVLPAPLLEHLSTSAPTSAPIHAAVDRTVNDLVSTWPVDRPLRLLLCGTQAGDIRRLAANPSVSSVTVTDPDNGRLDRIKLDLASGNGVEIVPFAEIGTDGSRYDVAVAVAVASRPDGDRAVAALVSALASSGLLMAVEPDASLFADMVFGQATAWWSGSIDPAFPVGCRRGADGVAEALRSAGAKTVIAAPLSAESCRAVVAVGRAPIRAPLVEPPSTSPVLVVVDGDRIARRMSDALAASIAGRGRPVRVANVRSDANGRAVLEAIDAGSDAELADLLKSGEFKDLVYAPAPVAADVADPLATARARIMAIHTVLNGAMTPPARLWIVAPGGSGLQAGETGARPVAIALWGLGRVVMNEYPDIETRLVDLAIGFEPSEAADRIARLLDQPGPEREIILDVRGTAAVRIEAGRHLVERATAGRITGEAGRTLVIERQGTLDGLAWRTVERRALADDEVEIAVAAAGLNFRDVMWALGLLPEEALEDGFAGATLGMECSGTVTRIGSKVTRFKPGSRVIAFAPACFSTHVVVSEKALAPVPNPVPLEAAATIPVTFLTAWYALVELARIEEGETVLIHGGAGGVGLAALQIALSRGARVIATAGSPDRRRLLSMLGASHVLDSRSVAFADEAMRLTDGEGVDVVLNSLFGEAMERSLEILKPFGRFVELGKRDYYANTQIGLRPFRQNLSYFGVDADQLLTHRPALTERVFRNLVAGFEDGTFTALPYRVFPAERITAAFRLMQQSGHIGKILVRPPTAPAPETGRAIAIRSDATYALFGGLGGFGVETARFLVARGARHLVLTSRSGKPSESAEAAIAALRAGGVDVLVSATDITDEAAVAALMARIDETMPPLKGVFHTAMVIDDALFRNLDRARIEAVMAPKIAGAAVLDRLTRTRELDLFVTYSSATTLIGNPGQAPYVAANAFLEGLARRRRADGLPGVAIAWGAIADAGYLARNAEVNDMLSMRLGKQSLTAKAALAGLGLLLDAGMPDPVVAYAQIDWASARRELPIMAMPLAARIAADGAETAADGIADGHLATLIEGLDHSAAVKVVTDLLAGEISRILRLPADEVDPARPLTEIGMDSLMALELRMAAERRLGIDIPLLSIANGAALSDVARRIVDKAGSGQAGQMTAEAEIATARHVGEEMDEDLTAAVEAVTAKAESVKRLI